MVEGREKRTAPLDSTKWEEGGDIVCDVGKGLWVVWEDEMRVCARKIDF